jgi:hypothetical protein
MDQLQPVAVPGLVPHDLGGAPALVQIARRADHVGSMGGQGAGGLDAQPGRGARYRIRLPLRSTPSSTSSVVDSAPKGPGMGSSIMLGQSIAYALQGPGRHRKAGHGR